MDIELDLITADPRAQPRAQLDLFTVQEYAEAMRQGATFPPVILFHDAGQYWLADGFHRVEAARLAGLAIIPADIRPGDLRAATLYSVGANAAHGLRRTNADKRKAVLTLLNDPEWRRKTDSEIARLCNVTQPFVLSLRRSSHITVICDKERVYTDRWGNVSTMNTANIGRATVTVHTPPPIENPPAPTVTVPRPLIAMVEAEPDADQEQARPQPAPSAPPVRYPLPIVVSRPTWERWQAYKANLGTSNDVAAFEKLLLGGTNV